MESQGCAWGLGLGHLALISVSVSPQGGRTCHVLSALPTGDFLPPVSLHCLLVQHRCVSTAVVSGNKCTENALELRVGLYHGGFGAFPKSHPLPMALSILKISVTFLYFWGKGQQYSEIKRHNLQEFVLSLCEWVLGIQFKALGLVASTFIRQMSHLPGPFLPLSGRALFCGLGFPGAHSVAQAGLQCSAILLPQPPNNWDSKSEPLLLNFPNS